MKRREFILRSSAAAAGISLCPRILWSANEKRLPLFTRVGITAGIERAAELAIYGADYVVPTVADLLMPDQSDSDFDQVLERVANLPIPILGCNSFLRDPSLRCTGPDADHSRVLGFSEIAFARLERVGGTVIGFGSNTSRQIPEGWPKERADEQFVELLSKMGPLAQKHGVTVSVESQRTQECNYLNTISEVANVVMATDHPNIRILADFYHMSVMGDNPEDLEKVAPWVGLVELAEKEKRTVPGVAGDDFRPYMRSLARGGYSGLINVEGDGNADQLKVAFQEIRKQAQDSVATL